MKEGERKIPRTARHTVGGAGPTLRASSGHPSAECQVETAKERGRRASYWDESREGSVFGQGGAEQRNREAAVRRGGRVATEKERPREGKASKAGIPRKRVRAGKRAGRGRLSDRREFALPSSGVWAECPGRRAGTASAPGLAHTQRSLAVRILVLFTGSAPGPLNVGGRGGGWGQDSKARLSPSPDSPSPFVHERPGRRAPSRSRL